MKVYIVQRLICADFCTTILVKKVTKTKEAAIKTVQEMLNKDKTENYEKWEDKDSYNITVNDDGTGFEIYLEEEYLSDCYQVWIVEKEIED